MQNELNFTLFRLRKHKLKQKVKKNMYLKKYKFTNFSSRKKRVFKQFLSNFAFYFVSFNPANVFTPSVVPTL